MYQGHPVLPLVTIGLGLALTATALAEEGSSPKPRTRRPPAVFLDRGACPFECCQYGPWIANQQTVLLDRPNGQRTVAVVKKGEHVQGLTGVVYVKPLRVTVRRRLALGPEKPVLDPGEVFYLLTDQGEGTYKVWARGEIVDAGEFDFVWEGRHVCWDSDQGCSAQPDGGRQALRRWASHGSVWWVKVQTSSGAVAWSRQTAHFDGRDGCG